MYMYTFALRITSQSELSKKVLGISVAIFNKMGLFKKMLLKLAFIRDKLRKLHRDGKKRHGQ